MLSHLWHNNYLSLNEAHSFLYSFAVRSRWFYALHNNEHCFSFYFHSCFLTNYPQRQFLPMSSIFCHCAHGLYSVQHAFAKSFVVICFKINSGLPVCQIYLCPTFSNKGWSSSSPDHHFLILKFSNHHPMFFR